MSIHPTQTNVSNLSLDLNNFRTVPQGGEYDAVKAMISISQDKFWGLLDSILDDGYLITENIIAIKDSVDPNKLIVKEGNRRVACLKLINGLITRAGLGIPANIEAKITALTPQWLADNSSIPCSVFDSTDSIIVDRLVSMAHGKGDKASRDKWSSVATARHNKEINGNTESGLDLLEKYLIHGRNLTGQQKDRWSGNYPLTVLDDAIKKLAPRVGALNSTDVANQYPNIQNRNELDGILLEIGLGNIKFDTIRNTDFATTYGIPPLPPVPPVTSTPTSSNPPTPAANNQTTSSPAGSNPQTSTPAQPGPNPPIAATQPPIAVALNSPQSVTSKLKLFNPRGNNRSKVVTLRDEALKLKIKHTPIAFCFILRSMFEISVKAYFTDNGLSVNQNNGREKSLADMLRESKNHLTANGTNTPMDRALHGAATELGRVDGILSVKSMNQLVHHPNFSVTQPDICVMFNNIYPMLEALN